MPFDAPVLETLGCRYILDDGSRQWCGDPIHARSLCRRHHAICYVAPGSKAEQARLGEVEALAEAVGGKRSVTANAAPSARFLRRLEGTAR